VAGTFYLAVRQFIKNSKTTIRSSNGGNFRMKALPNLMMLAVVLFNNLPI
jgi:hypothetical protein